MGANRLDADAQSRIRSRHALDQVEKLGVVIQIDLGRKVFLTGLMLGVAPVMVNAQR
jgi:hypothetical protein